MKEHPQKMPSHADEGHPPTLEQILQTIRGVISEGETTLSEDVLVLTEMLNEDGSVVSIKQTTPLHSAVSSPAFSYSKKEVAQPASVSGDNLLSEASAAISAKALKDLVNVVSKKVDGKEPVSSTTFRSGQTLEEMVLELLKPQLSQWLDRHLPTLIQQLVTQEIQKLLPPHKGQ